MTKTFNTERKDREEFMDATFKRFVRNKHVLSTLLKGYVREFRDSDIEEIIGCLDVDADTDIVKGRPTEFISDNVKKIVYDSIYDVRLPGKNEKVGIIINLEGQTKDQRNLFNRALYYGSALIVDQKGKIFSGKEFGKLKKVYSIWCILKPAKNKRNSIASYTFNGNYFPGYESEEAMENCDFLEIVMVGVGQFDETENRTDPNDATSRAMGLLDVFFDVEMTNQEKSDVMQTVYNIPYDDNLKRSLEDIETMIDDEEFKQAVFEEKMEIACEKAAAITSARLLSTYMRKTGSSLEQAMDYLDIPEEHRESIAPLVKL